MEEGFVLNTQPAHGQEASQEASRSTTFVKPQRSESREKKARDLRKQSHPSAAEEEETYLLNLRRTIQAKKERKEKARIEQEQRAEKVDQQLEQLRKRKRAIQQQNEEEEGEHSDIPTAPPQPDPNSKYGIKLRRQEVAKEL